MEQSKIKLIIENYLTDHNIYDQVKTEDQVKEIQDKLFEEVIKTLHHVREYDDDFLYDYFNNLHLFQQQKIICTLLDFYFNNDDNNEPLFEFFGIISASILATIFGIIALLKYNRPFTKKLSQTTYAIGKINEKIGKVLVKYGRYFQFQYSIIQQNSEKCYKACGIDNLRKMPADIYFYTRTIDSDKKKKVVRQADCLARCYIDQQIQINSMILKLYFLCLKNTKKFDEYAKLSDKQIYGLLFQSSTRKQQIIGSECESYFSLASKAFAQFNDLIDYVYVDDREKHIALTKLYDAIKEARDEVKNTPINNLNKKYK